MKFKNGTIGWDRFDEDRWIAASIVSLIVILMAFFIAILGSFVFIGIDYLNPKIADNVLNPICCSVVMMIPVWIFFL